MSMTMNTGTEIKTMAEAVDDLRNFAANPKQRVRTGFDSIDYFIEGPAPGEVCTIIGRSYTGKSLLATNIMINHPEAHSIFFSLEMTRRMAMARLLAQYANFDAQRVRDAIASNSIPDMIDDMAYELRNHVIVDRSGLSVPDMMVVIEDYQAMFGRKPDFIQIDYLERVGGIKSSAEGWQATEAAADQIKDLAKTMDIPVFLYHQTNRSEDEWAAPTERSARGGGFTEADFVLAMWAPGRNPKLPISEQQALRNTVNINVLKNRHSGQANDPWRPLEFVRSESLRFIDQGSISNGHEAPAWEQEEDDDMGPLIEAIEEAEWN